MCTQKWSDFMPSQHHIRVFRANARTCCKAGVCVFSLMHRVFACKGFKSVICMSPAGGIYIKIMIFKGSPWKKMRSKYGPKIGYPKKAKYPGHPGVTGPSVTVGCPGFLGQNVPPKIGPHFWWKSVPLIVSHPFWDPFGCVNFERLRPQIFCYSSPVLVLSQPPVHERPNQF